MKHKNGFYNGFIVLLNEEKIPKIHREVTSGKCRSFQKSFIGLINQEKTWEMHREVKHVEVTDKHRPYQKGVIQKFADAIDVTKVEFYLTDNLGARKNEKQDTNESF